MNKMEKDLEVKQLETVFIKEEVLDMNYQSEEQHLDNKFFNEEIIKEVKLENQLNVNNLYLTDIKQEKINDFHLKPFVKSELSDAGNLSSYQELHKEEFLDDFSNENEPIETKPEIDQESNENDSLTESLRKPFTWVKCEPSYLATDNTIHLGSKPHSCTICGKSFTRKSGLEGHLAIHGDRKLYSCAMCNREFLQKYSLRLHIMAHRGQFLHSCSKCDKQFLTSTKLKLHKLMHSNEKPYSCSICKKRYIQRSNLKSHMAVHTSERPYTCSTCGSTFAHKSSLNRHALVHSYERPYSCTLCKKSYKEKANLKRHMLHHTKK